MTIGRIKTAGGPWEVLSLLEGVWGPVHNHAGSSKRCPALRRKITSRPADLG